MATENEKCLLKRSAKLEEQIAIRKEKMQKAQEDAEKVFEEIFPIVSKPMKKFFLEKIIPDLDKQLKDISEEVKKTGRYRRPELEVWYRKEINSCDMKLIYCYKSGRNIESDNIPMRPKTYQLKEETFLRILKEVCLYYGIDLEESETRKGDFVVTFAE